MKKILIICLFTLLLSSCVLSPKNTAWDHIQKKGYFTVGLDATFAPMGFTSDTGEFIGFDIDMAYAIGDVLDLEVRFQAIDWQTKEFELNQGHIDMIWNGFTITQKRKEQVLFSSSYMDNNQVIITYDDTITNLSDLNQKTVGVQANSSGLEAIEKSSIYDDILSLIKYDDYALALIELKNRTIDAIVIDEIVARYILKTTTHTFNILDENLGKESYGIGFKLGEISLYEQFELALLAVKNSGKALEISKKWFDINLFTI